MEYSRDEEGRYVFAVPMPTDVSIFAMRRTVDAFVEAGDRVRDEDVNRQVGRKVGEYIEQRLMERYGVRPLLIHDFIEDAFNWQVRFVFDDVEEALAFRLRHSL